VARNHVSRLVNAPDPRSIIFTSCGSEADNRAVDIAVSNFLRAYPSNPPALPHVITSVIEHPAILEYLSYLSDVENVIVYSSYNFRIVYFCCTQIIRCFNFVQKIEVTILPVDGEGFVSPDDVSKALKYNTALVTIMHSNNEVGTLQPIRRIGDVIAAYNSSLRMTTGTSHEILFHSDGAQSLGKVLIDVQHENIDILTIVGHKFGAPKGKFYYCLLKVRNDTNKRIPCRYCGHVRERRHSCQPTDPWRWSGGWKACGY
jgi:cysteine desulfurase